MPVTITTLAVAQQNTDPIQELAGAAIGFMPLYRDDSDPANIVLKPADSTSQVKAQIIGFAINIANASGEVINYLPAGSGNSPGDIDLGASLLTAGGYYVLSPTSGKIQLDSARVTGDWNTLVGYALTTQILRLVMFATGIVTP